MRVSGRRAAHPNAISSSAVVVEIGEGHTCPLWISPVPDDTVTSTNDAPPRLRRSTLPTVEA
jgi:hypothetical protein